MRQSSPGSAKKYLCIPATCSSSESAEHLLSLKQSTDWSSSQETCKEHPHVTYQHALSLLNGLQSAAILLKKFFLL